MSFITFLRPNSFSSSGEGAPSRTVVVKTHPFAPTAPPQDVRVAAISSTTLRVTWKPPPVEARNGDIIKYRIIYEVGRWCYMPFDRSYSTLRANQAKIGGLIFVTLISFPIFNFLYST